MTHKEKIKIIRNALDRYQSDDTYKKAIAVLDSLEVDPPMCEASTTPTSPVHVISMSVEPRDDVKSFKNKIIYLLNMASESRIPEMYMEQINEFITDRDRRKKMKYVDILRTLPCVNDNETEIRREDAINSIIGVTE